MTQNKGRIIDLLIGNLANGIVHSILEKSAGFIGLSEKYRKELINSFNIAKTYREKLNPLNTPLTYADKNYIRFHLQKRVNSELRLRISRGYKNINLSLIEEEIDNIFKKLKIE